MSANHEHPADEELRPGDILLFEHGSGAAWLISFVTRSRYYHVAIVSGPTAIIEARPGGVARNDLRNRRGGRFFRRIPAPASPDEAAAAVRWAHSQVGAGYDIGGAVAAALDRIFVHMHVNKVSGDRFTCGEFVTLAFREAGRTLFPDIEPEDVEPKDFARFLPAD